MKRTVAAAIAIAALSISGCSASQVVNTGGGTKCKDFVTQDEQKQDSEVTKMLKDANGADPSAMELKVSRRRALMYCQTVGRPDNPISNAPHR